MMEIEVISARTNKHFGKCRVTEATTIAALRSQIHKELKGTPIADRLSLRPNPKGKAFNDFDTIQSLNLQNGDKVFLRDLGPQIGWKTVFLAEYAGPLVVYLYFYTRPQLFYGRIANASQISLTAHIAASCYTFHYVKRLLETIFVHRFSHSTMPMRNLFKNCAYYWGFTGYVSYHVNHPFFTTPCLYQVYAALGLFLLCEMGNFSVHIALRNLRPPGTKIRKIPMPDSNPLTKLFNLVSCPNYTYEIGAWISFSVMTSCLPAMLFAFAGAYQMTIWALGKHRNYKKEFKDYPKQRRAIFPFIL